MGDLESELEAARRTVSTDSYPMSVGELTNMYSEGDLIIRPPFQRLFRWDEDQKSRLIESILIGIPLPSIFVAQDEDGRWELVDGLQRISTLLQLQGLLDKEGFPALTLRATKYLPSLEGLMWDDREDAAEALSPAQRRDIKRAKVDLKIVQRESDPKTKFDLFQRLNSFGSKLSNQEIRNAQLVGVNPEFVEWIGRLAAHESFGALLRLPEGDMQRKYDEELVLRFLYLHAMSDKEIEGIRNFQDGLQEFAIDLALKFTQEYKEQAERVFKKTFDLLSAADEKIFGRWDGAKGDFKGGFLNSSFEALAISLGFLLRQGTDIRTDLRDCAIEFWQLPAMNARFATGKSTEARLSMMVPVGRKIISA
ncbi:hypothetical protein GCM10012320_26700 [Sinomonas cellulolyticus]|uniref:DUF262 domain-containing protein n=1 Tax=Sinomonas cellulolyticus TaxID=2801916 RepID=A0ABS1K3R5_9MICC|nr:MULTISPECIES: DUF262 domain-containing protein [Sinomonas]MBL0706133.1 DUF262 domain-containing protein [Sinomonas cellulolyticus]GHG55117.1 hypothetical protein GCM10012320_26700 [Sinomonas sp. KCTC 49339]